MQARADASDTAAAASPPSSADATGNLSLKAIHSLLIEVQSTVTALRTEVAELNNSVAKN